MRSALIGYTGFVGSNLLKQTSFTDLYNSKNILDIKGKEYDLIISAANSSTMWMVNQEPEKDYNNIEEYKEIIKNVHAKHFVLLSTIEVYDNPRSITEDSPITQERLTPYGKHRYALEKFIEKRFPSQTIVRMPNLYGLNLKKNFVYDLIHTNALDFTHCENMQQWYNLKNLWEDINTAIKHKLPTVNLAVEPISCRELAKYTLNIDFTSVTKNPPRKYDMRSKYGKLYHSQSPYLYQKEETLNELKKFIQEGKV